MLVSAYQPVRLLDFLRNKRIFLRMNLFRKTGLFIVIICLPAIMAAQLPLHFQDHFTSWKKGWHLTDPTSTEPSPEGLQLRQADPLGTVRCLRECLYRHSDLYRIDLRVMPQGPGLSYQWGIVWGASRHSDTYYAFLLRADGSYAIQQVHPKGDTWLRPWTRNRKIKMQQIPITMSIEKRGWRVYFSVNGKEVDALLDLKMTGKYHGMVLMGAGGVLVQSFEMYRDEQSILHAGGRFPNARRRDLDSTINQPHTEETAPRLGPDHHSLYLTRSAKGNLFPGQLLRSVVQGDSMWAVPEPVFDPNLPGRTEAFFVGKSQIQVAQQTGFSPSGIYQAKGHDTLWTSPNPVPIAALAQLQGPITAHESEDGKTMIVSGIREGGFGGQDLYALFRQSDGNWGELRNLGATINTFEDEFAPWLDPDGLTLYFASGGHPGYGGWDLYRCQRLTQTWTKWSDPENLGPRVNTHMDEGWYFQFQHDRAYLASQDSVRGDFDIIGLRLPVDVTELAVVRLRGHILNRDTGVKMAGEIFMRPTKEDSIRKTISVPSPGDGYSSLITFGRSYQMYAIVPGYFPLIDTLDLRSVKAFRDVRKDLYVKPFEVGDAIRLDKVYFERSTAVLLSESFEELDRLVALMKSIPTLEIEIGGHTDNLGGEGELRILSELRAERVEAYLLERGIEARRMRAVGYGPDKPVADNVNPETRPLNRRVEFLIIRK